MRLGDFDALKEVLFIKFGNQLPNGLFDEIDNAPTIEPFEKIGAICNENCGYRPQGDLIQSLTELCNRYCKNCPIPDRPSNDCTDCICTHIRGIMKGGAE